MANPKNNIKPEVRNTLIKNIKYFEGYEPKTYKDSQGIPTVGYGINLNDPSNLEFIRKNTPYKIDQVLKGKVNFSEKYADKFINNKLNNVYREAKNLHPNLDNYPAQIQNVIMDLDYNMGPTKLAQFKKFNNALQKGNYLDAAEELKNSNYYNQTGRRAKTHYDTLSTLGLKASKTPVESEEGSKFSDFMDYLGNSYQALSTLPVNPMSPAASFQLLQFGSQPHQHGGEIHPAYRMGGKLTKQGKKVRKYGPRPDYMNTMPEHMMSGPMMQRGNPNLMFADGGYTDAQREQYGLYTHQGNTPYDLVYNNGQYSAVPKGMSQHYSGETGITGSPCGPGFALDYNEKGQEVCVPLKNIPGPGLVPDYGRKPLDNSPTTVLASWDPFTEGQLIYGQGVEPLETNSYYSKADIRKANRKVKNNIPESRGIYKHNAGPSFFTKLGRTFRNIATRCLPGEDCPQFADGGWVYPTNTGYPKYADGGATKVYTDPEEFKKATQAYEDSLNSYNIGKSVYKNIGKTYDKLYGNNHSYENYLVKNYEAGKLKYSLEENQNRIFGGALQKPLSKKEIQQKINIYNDWAANSEPEWKNLFKNQANQFSRLLNLKVSPYSSTQSSELPVILSYKKPTVKPVYQEPVPTYNITHSPVPYGPPNMEIPPQEETIMMPNGIKIPRAEFENRYGTNVTRREFEKKADGGWTGYPDHTMYSSGMERFDRVRDYTKYAKGGKVTWEIID